MATGMKIIVDFPQQILGRHVHGQTGYKSSRFVCKGGSLSGGTDCHDPSGTMLSAGRPMRPVGGRVSEK